jgi:uncharacterized OB-fold protein
MKLAMKCQFIYQLCNFCYEQVFYPSNFCKNCKAAVQFKYVKWYIETKIEKVSKHLFLFQQNVYRPPKRNIRIIIST